MVEWKDIVNDEKMGARMGYWLAILVMTDDRKVCWWGRRKVLRKVARMGLE